MKQVPHHETAGTSLGPILFNSPNCPPGIFLLCPTPFPFSPGSQQTQQTPLSGFFLLSFSAMPIQGRPSMVSPCLLLSSRLIHLSPLAVSLARLLTLSLAPQAHSTLNCFAALMLSVPPDLQTQTNEACYTCPRSLSFPTTFLAYSVSSGENLSSHLLRQDSCPPTTNGTLYATLLVGFSIPHPLCGILHHPFLITLSILSFQVGLITQPYLDGTHYTTSSGWDSLHHPSE